MRLVGARFKTSRRVCVCARVRAVVLWLLKVYTAPGQLHKFVEEKSIENYQICRNGILLRKSLS